MSFLRLSRRPNILKTLPPGTIWSGVICCATLPDEKAKSDQALATLFEFRQRHQPSRQESSAGTTALWDTTGYPSDRAASANREYGGWQAKRERQVPLQGVG